MLENLRCASDRRGRLGYLGSLVRPRDVPLPPAAVAAVHEFGLVDALDRKPTELSYGRRRLVAIARSVACGGSFLLLDEPVAGLGGAEADELATLIRRLVDDWNLGVLVIEHDVSFVMSVCDEITVLDFGEQIAYGSPDAVRADPRVLAAYLGTADAPAATDVRDRTVSIVALARPRSGEPEVAVNLDGYVVVDDFFGAPYVDVDEERADPLPHRYVHGGFAGTDTRFSCYFPPAEEYRDRMFHAIEGGLGGQESFHSTPVADLLGMGIRSVFHLGGYIVESNQGHIGPSPCAKAGDDPTIYGYRGRVESRSDFRAHRGTRCTAARPPTSTSTAVAVAPIGVRSPSPTPTCGMAPTSSTAPDRSAPSARTTTSPPPGGGSTAPGSTWCASSGPASPN